MGAYRYGFNGKEEDPEGMGGGGSTYDYGFRIYNPRIAKFLSVDPLASQYAELTPFQFASNTPIWAIDIDGLEAGYTVSYNVFVDKNGNYVTEQLHDPVLTIKNGDWSGIRTDNKFFHNGNFIGNNQDNVSGWSVWRKSQQKEFNKGASALAVGVSTVLLAIPSGGSSLFLAAGLGGTEIALGSFKLYQASEGRVEEYKNLPLGLGEVAGGFIGAQYGNEILGQKIGSFTESMMTGIGDVRNLGDALKSKDALKIVVGMQSLYDIGSDGYQVLDGLKTEIDKNLNSNLENE
ncbi:RHS repeat protein [Lunatibacter salilacus]|uniref:RHS repeat protein n=1 Tax=Lunatibacter salilacus TaxID=2483804 RepID=UPI00131C100B|nr:RHS repeat-associated core domain-containing protein [Lunatibacter salilacus]